MIRIAVDLNLVDIALAHNGPITAAELALKSKADVELICKHALDLPETLELTPSRPHPSPPRRPRHLR